MTEIDVTEYLDKNPPNLEFVKALAQEIITYIKSCYKEGEQLTLRDWYVGVSHEPYKRYSQHLKSKRLEYLLHHKVFYAKNLSNARAVECLVCKTLYLKNCNRTGGVNLQTKHCYVFNLKKSRPARVLFPKRKKKSKNKLPPQ